MSSAQACRVCCGTAVFAVPWERFQGDLATLEDWQGPLRVKLRLRFDLLLCSLGWRCEMVLAGPVVSLVKDLEQVAT